MSERPGWRVVEGAWVLGDVCGYLRVLPDGTLESEEDVFRLDRAEARTLAALLDAYAETGKVPMDGTVPQESKRVHALGLLVHRLRRELERVAPGLDDALDSDAEKADRAATWLVRWTDWRFAYDAPDRWWWSVDNAEGFKSDAEVVLVALAEGWTE